MGARVELLQIIQREDSQALVSFVQNGSLKQNDLSEVLAECSRRCLDDMWEGLRRMSTGVLLDAEMEENDKNKEKEKILLISSVAQLAIATIHVQEVIIPQSLIDTATIFHDILPLLPDEADSIKNRLAQLFETWWRLELEGRERVVPNTLLYLLERSLQAKCTAADVKVVWRLHSVLPMINFDDDSSGPLKNLLGRCCSSYQYLKTDEGRRFLSFAFTVHEGLVECLHKAIKNQMPFAPKSWLPLYGEVYYRAWQRSTDTVQQIIERDCIQDLMNHAVHASRNGCQAMFPILFKVLSYLHRQKKQRGVDAMLLRLYEPILWRSLSVPNTDVRTNSASLLLDAFPLQNPDSTAEEVDLMLQKQFDLMQRLLADPCPVVRAVTGEGVCLLMSEYLDMLPVEVVQTLLRRLLQELVWDASSPSVRLAVVKGITAMLENPLCHFLLKPLLPRLSYCLHDNAEVVRLAMMKLLLKVKSIRAIKYWNICPIEHLLARLEVDSQPIVRRIVELLFPSFMPLDQSPQEQILRCITLIESNPGAARVFWLNVPSHMTLTDTVKFMALVCRYVLESVRQMGHDSDDGTDTSPSGSKRKSSRDVGQQEEQAAEKNEDEDQNLSAEVLQGLLEVIYLMWTAVAKQLDARENMNIKQSLMKKLSVMIPDVLKITQEPRVVSLVIELAGHLPPKAVPSISVTCLSKLRNLTNDSGAGECTELLEAMCRWERASEILQMISDWLKDFLMPTEAPQAVPSKKGGAAKKRVQILAPEENGHPDLAINYLSTMLRSSVCKQMLMEHHLQDCDKLNRLLSHVLVVIKKQLQCENCPESADVDNRILVEQILSLHLRMSVLLHRPEEHCADCVIHMKSILEWGKESLLPCIGALPACKSGDGYLEGENQLISTAENWEWRSKLASNCIVTILDICCNMLMVGFGDKEFAMQLSSFCKDILYTAEELRLVDGVLSVLYQMVLFEDLLASGDVSNSMTHIMTALNMCLRRPSNREPRAC
ncbi:condensin-2 complex subunit G2-like isoform X1 [Pomacea canaliculata]|uniref:condensin-2 complex subunit G2-like isoform X1 n=1 Tax=Pomacea canaliculata TaxID=400727 RepID=UPI000D728A83|nr:condensin-2 complex subunit G2-like isoform X1 [Pomacea canaliculata]